MNADYITSFSYLYLFVAIVVSIFVAEVLEKRLKARTPATRPYRWGFYFGCMGVACVPLVPIFALGAWGAGTKGQFGECGEFLFYLAWSVIGAVSGWFVIQRKRWAWVVCTIFSCNIILWIPNYIYGRKRWGEFVGEPYARAEEDKGYELLADATKLEAQGRVQEAIAAYQRIADKYSHTAAGQDAQKSIESLQVKIG
jgi:hypothetical protein